MASNAMWIKRHAARTKFLNEHKLLARYATCKACRLWRVRRQVVFGRGMIPADILFVGEAPGTSEDFLGEAFIGKSGKLLDAAIDRAGFVMASTSGKRRTLEHCERPSVPSYFITNVVGCHPTDKLRGINRQPREDEIAACRPRLMTTIKLVKPKVVVALGRVAEGEIVKTCPDATALPHPAYILRRGGRTGADFREFVSGLVDIFRSVM